MIAPKFCKMGPLILPDPIKSALEPLITEQVATIDDTTHIKNWLVGLGWNPSEYKEKDLSVDQKKQKLSKEKYEAAVNRYVEQTLNCNFCDDRLERIGTTRNKLKEKLLNAKWETKGVKVLTNPSFTKGQDKEMCPDLERISEQFPYAKDVVEYLTFKHRRNSILGGGLEWDDDEEPEKFRGRTVNVLLNKSDNNKDCCLFGFSKNLCRLLLEFPLMVEILSK